MGKLNRLYLKYLIIYIKKHDERPIIMSILGIVIFLLMGFLFAIYAIAYPIPTDANYHFLGLVIYVSIPCWYLMQTLAVVGLLFSETAQVYLGIYWLQKTKGRPIRDKIGEFYNCPREGDKL